MSTKETATTLGQRLERRRVKAGAPSFRKLERQLVLALGEYGPSSETIRRLHAGQIAPEAVDLIVLAALCDLYNCTIKDVSNVASERLNTISDLLVRQTRCTVQSLAAA